jgi:hypothetical protein
MSPTVVYTKNKHKLRVSPEPFKSSYLAIPPSPFSPRTPVVPSSYPPTRRARNYPTPDTSVRPDSPLQWLWQCHQCRRTYFLGVTRRCLDDGHNFCAGTTTIKTWRKPSHRSGRVKKHRACASEFDYQGWKNWGRWRRSGRRDSIYDADSSASEYSTSSGSTSSTNSEQYKEAVKDCWNSCDYPSECRWGRRFGVHTPVATEFPTIEVNPPPPPPPPSDSTTFEGILKPENCKEARQEKKADMMDLWGALVASATRRKSVPPSSPLASVAEGAPQADPAAGLSKDEEGDVVMTVDPALVLQQPLETAPASSVSTVANALMPVVSLKDLLRKRTRLGSKTSSMPTEAKEEIKSDPMDVVSPSAVVLGEFDFEVAEREKGVGELAPLTRVKSSHSGYHSTLDAS